MSDIELPDVSSLVTRLKSLGEAPEVQELMVDMAQDAALVATLALTNPKSAARASAQLKAQAALLGSAQAEVFAREWQAWAMESVAAIVRYAIGAAL